MTADDRPFAHNSTLRVGRNPIGRKSLPPVVVPVYLPGQPRRTGSRTRVRPGVRSSPAAFSPKVRNLVRLRALSMCEACGVYLAPGEAELQHRVARGLGGSRNHVLGSAVNAAFMCRDDHRRAEARDPQFHAWGFWLNSWEDPATVPIMLHGQVEKLLTADGGYADTSPMDAAS